MVGKSRLIALGITGLMLASCAQRGGLPDYTKAPFTETDRGIGTPRLHSEAGPMYYEEYTTAPEPGPGESGIRVYMDSEGHARHLVWQRFTGDHSYTLRFYIRRRGMWVFEYKRRSK